MSKNPSFTFRLLGRADGWFALRAPTWKTKRRNGLDALSFENAVAAWLLAECEAEDWHLGNGNVAGYPKLPQAFSTGSGLCLMLKRGVDLIRFSNEFALVNVEDVHEMIDAA